MEDEHPAPDPQDLPTRLTALLTARFDVEEGAVGPEATYAELGLDSLDVVLLALDIEEHLGVRLDEGDAEHLETVGSTVALLAERGAG